MIFQREYLDLILVPSGLLIMFFYHIFLLYKYLNHSNSTFIGIENKDKEEWVQSLLQNGESGDYDRAVNVISSNTSAAIYLSTISLTLCSLIGTWLGSSSANNLLQSRKIYGDTRPLTIFLKDISLLLCLLLAFSGFIQAAIHLIHANYLMSSPDKKKQLKKLQFQITKVADFWQFGLRSLYFAVMVLLWFFGPIPMFVSSIIMVAILYYHDIYSVTLHKSYCDQNVQKGMMVNTRFGDKFSY
ncbi:hypothetical protein M5689_008883 [Euphorbia peplus]|nr:hypothetical protein M5689_008883 [Euphorbia peplus]